MSDEIKKTKTETADYSEDERYDRRGAVIKALLKWLECEFFGLFIFLSLLALTLVLKTAGYVVFGALGLLTYAMILVDFGLKEGSEMSFSPYGTDEHYTVRVAGILRSLTESVIMTAEYARRQGIPYSISSLFTAETDIEAGPQILNTQSKQSVMDSFGTFIELMDTMVWLLVVAAVALGIVVLYNLGIMSYTERYREMATLKVVGFRNSRIARLLITQNLWLTVLGVIAGLPLGVAVLQYLLTALASEYEMKLTLGPGTYLVSLILTFGVSLAVGAMVARKNRHIDMVAALKTEE